MRPQMSGELRRDLFDHLFFIQIAHVHLQPHFRSVDLFFDQPAVVLIEDLFPVHEDPRIEADDDLPHIEYDISDTVSHK